MSEHPVQSAPRLFNVLCVLVIVGNLFLIGANLFKWGLLEAGIRNGGVGEGASHFLTLLIQLVLLSCVGSIVGAAFMLGGKRLGYRIYAVSTIVHLVMTFCAMLLWAMTIYLLFVAGILFMYAFIPMGFWLYFYLNRRFLS